MCVSFVNYAHDEDGFRPYFPAGAVMKLLKNTNTNRRGMILVLGVILLVAVFAFVAFTVDIGHMAVVRTQLQGAADAAALGSAQDIPSGGPVVRNSAKSLGALNSAAGEAVAIADADVELGFYDFAAKTFIVNPSAPNAVRVTARVTDKKLFFAPILGTDSFDMSASCIGMLNPRDVVFVVDLSGSMNDDTEPCWATEALTEKYTPLGYPTVANDLMQVIYTDLGFGSFPGNTEYLAASLGIAENDYAYAELTKDDGVLTGTGVAATYRILNTDDEPTRKQKAYRWIIDYQIATVMPNAKPTPDSTTNFAYWEKYIDYICDGAYVGEPPPPTGGGGGTTSPPTTPPGPTGPTPPPTIGFFQRHSLDSVLKPALFASAYGRRSFLSSASSSLMFSPGPLASSYPGCPRRGGYTYMYLPQLDSDRIHRFNNPNTASFPTGTVPWGWRNWIGYRTYVQFMMDWGRERSPEFANSGNSNPALTGKTPLSVLSPDCPFHEEDTAGGKFMFPPRSQPMHSVRRALIAGINLIRNRNALVAGGSGDRVSIVTFDGRDGWHAPQIVLPLTDDYQAAMTACTTLQAAGDIGATTSTESGVDLARTHLLAKTTISNPADDPTGPQGRKFTSKVIVLLTDGMPNSWDMEQTVLDDYISSNGNANFYPTGYDWFNSVLAQTQQFYKDQRGKLYSVGMGLGTDYDFMDRIARIASTDSNGLSPRGTGNPAQYEQQLINTLESIINSPGSRMVE